MVQARAPTRNPVSSRDPRQAASPAQTIAPEVGHKRRISPFWRHFLEMLTVMVVGMIAAVAIFLTIVQATWDEALVQYPVHSLLVVAAGMTVPMVAWMRLRGHGWRGCAEMAAAMVVPVIPFLCLVWFNVIKSAQCGPYCVATVAAMLGLMLYRRSEYAMVGGQRRTMTHAPSGPGERMRFLWVRNGASRSGLRSWPAVEQPRIERTGGR